MTKTAASRSFQKIKTAFDFFAVGFNCTFHAGVAVPKTREKRKSDSTRFRTCARKVASAGRPDAAPRRRDLHRVGIARRKKNPQLMGRQRLGRRVLAGRPPAEMPARQVACGKAKNLVRHTWYEERRAVRRFVRNRCYVLVPGLGRSATGVKS